MSGADATGMRVERLPTPRLVTLRPRDAQEGRRPAVLLGFITDEHGRCLWAEIVHRSAFVHISTVEDDTDGI